MSDAYKLDKKSKQLLSLLYADSRMSFVQLGKKLKLSSSAVERRLRQLQNSGVISLLFADVNFAKLGFKSYRIYLKFDVMDKELEQDLIKFFEKYPRTLWGVVCDGEYDALWRIIAKNEFDLENAISLILQKFGTRIIEKVIVTTIHHNYLSWNKALGTERQAQFPSEKLGEIVSVDEIDMSLLSALYQNARESSVSLSKLVNITPDAVQYRIKKLIQTGLIMGYSAWFNAKKLGFNYYKLMISFRGITEETEKEFVKFCGECDDIIFLNKTIGSWDIELDVLVRDTSELHAFLVDLKTRFNPIMGKHKYLSAIEERMLNPLRKETNL